MNAKTEIAPAAAPRAAVPVRTSTMGILFALSFCHLLNDSVQALIPAIYPLLKETFSLSFTQIGLITFTFQMVGSVFQPIIGFYTDKHPKPYSLVVGMGFTLVGLVALAFAPTYYAILVSAALVGFGSAIFHPESSRMARLASGGRHGFAQSLFQVGGNAGTSLGPLLAAAIIIPHGQRSIAWFSAAALVGMVVLTQIGRWYKSHPNLKKKRAEAPHVELSRERVAAAIGILVLLVFSKYFYLASINSYFTFYLIDRFHLPVQAAQIHLFIFLAAVAAGTIIGGPVGDRIGRKYVIWGSILGVAPFTLLLPYANLFWTSVLTVIIGVVLASAFSAILVYAQELIPGKVGMVAGLFFGFAFGLGGIGAAVLGQLADVTSIAFVYKICSFLPLIGVLTVFLPDIEVRRLKKTA